MNTSLDLDYQSKRPYRTLLRALDMTWLRSFKVISVCVIKSSPTWAAPLYIEQVLAAARQPELYTSSYIIWISIAYLLLLVQNVPTHAWFANIISRYNRGMEMRLRSALVRRLQQLSIAFYNSAESGKLQTKILRDVDDITMLSRIFFTAILAGIISCVSAIVICLCKDPWMLLVFALLGWALARMRPS